MSGYLENGQRHDGWYNTRDTQAGLNVMPAPHLWLLSDLCGLSAEPTSNGYLVRAAKSS
jgi:hypothetical protein